MVLNNSIGAEKYAAASCMLFYPSIESLHEKIQMAMFIITIDK